MKQNKKAQAIFIGIMMGIMLLIVLVAILTPLKQQFTYARDADHLNCTSADISDGVKSACVVTDFGLFYFIGMILGVIGLYFGGKFLYNKVVG